MFGCYEGCDIFISLNVAGLLTSFNNNFCKRFVYRSLDVLLSALFRVGDFSSPDTARPDTRWADLGLSATRETRAKPPAEGQGVGRGLLITG